MQVNNNETPQNSVGAAEPARMKFKTRLTRKIY